jgi:hypothetical protein
MEKRGRKPRVVGDTGRYNLHIVLTLREAQILREMAIAAGSDVTQSEYVRRLILGAAVSQGIVKPEINGQQPQRPAPTATCAGPPVCTAPERIVAA